MFLTPDSAWAGEDALLEELFAEHPDVIYGEIPEPPSLPEDSIEEITPCD